MNQKPAKTETFFSFRLSVQELDDLKRIAKQDDRTVAAYLRRLIRQALKEMNP